MARYTGPVWKKSRRLGYSILETGKEFGRRGNGSFRRQYAPGQHGQRRKSNLNTDYNYKRSKEYVLFMV